MRNTANGPIPATCLASPQPASAEPWTTNRVMNSAEPSVAAFWLGRQPEAHELSLA